MKKSFYLLFGLIATHHAWGQSRRAAWENNVALNYTLKEWKLNTSIGHRTTRQKSEGSISNQLTFVEINQFITRKISPEFTASFGYKYRKLNLSSSENSHEQRLTQQLAYIHKNHRIRLISRFRSEQRFGEAGFKHRYRYRFSLDMPLSGVKLDLREFYFVASNEVLLEIEKPTHSFDNRATIGLGYFVSTLYKLQLDYTHRLENLGQGADHVPFINTSLIFNF